MSFEVFYEKVFAYMKEAGIKHARFFREDGKHIARFSEGITITGNHKSARLCVCWGSGHRAFVNA